MCVFTSLYIHVLRSAGVSTDRLVCICHVSISFEKFVVLILVSPVVGHTPRLFSSTIIHLGCVSVFVSSASANSLFKFKNWSEFTFKNFFNEINCFLFIGYAYCADIFCGNGISGCVPQWWLSLLLLDLQLLLELPILVPIWFESFVCSGQGSVVVAGDCQVAFVE